MKYLGLDFGLRRIGLATSAGVLASPEKVLEVKGLRDAVDKISNLAKKEDFDKVIIGQPEGEIGKQVVKFIEALEKRGLDVDTVDEHLSSKNASQLMIERGIPKKKRRINDAYSAALILQSYLDN